MRLILLTLHVLLLSFAVPATAGAAAAGCTYYSFDHAICVGEGGCTVGTEEPHGGGGCVVEAASAQAAAASPVHVELRECARAVAGCAMLRAALA